MIISDGTLRDLIDKEIIGINPFDPEAVQPASIDVRASGQFRVFRNDGTTHIDPRKEQLDLTEEAEQKGDKPFVLHPGEFVLGSTVEFFGLPSHIVGRLEGKSSLGRLGLVIHSTAGFIDPGFHGTITLELSNAATLPICLWANMPIGQVSFQFLDRACEIPYGDERRDSKYQGQSAPTASKMHQNFEHVDGYPDTVEQAVLGVDVAEEHGVVISHPHRVLPPPPSEDDDDSIIGSRLRRKDGIPTPIREPAPKPAGCICTGVQRETTMWNRNCPAHRTSR